MVASLYSSCVLGCRHEWVWAVRKRVEAVGVGLCTHSWLICITVLTTCIRKWLMFVDSRDESICMKPITEREGRVEGPMAGGMTKVFSGIEARSA